MSTPDHSETPRPNCWFATTHWTVLLQAKDKRDPGTETALAQLCQTYWPPIYAYLRRSGNPPADAEDLTQSFFVHLFAQDFLQHLHHQRGKFRSFLLKFLKHFLSDVRDKALTQKRGGDRVIISLDGMEAAERQAVEPSVALTADQVFERQWAQTLMQRAIGHLRAEYVAEGKAELFEQLKDLEPGERGARRYAQLGARLGLSENGVKSAVHRMRLRHREMIRREIAATIGTHENIDEEIQQMIQALGTG